MSSPDIRQVRQRVTTELRQAEAQRGSGEEAAMAKATSPTGQQAASATVSGRGSIQWVPLADVLQGRGARLAELHAHGQENLIRGLRHGMAHAATSRRGVARQASSLPPVSQFGQQAPAVQTQAVGA